MSPAEPRTAAEEPTPGPAVAMLWWVGLPSLFRRVSASVFAYLLDGVWVFAFRPLAVVATPLALGVGLIIGTTTAGYEVAPFESILVLTLIVAVSTINVADSPVSIGDLRTQFQDWPIEGLSEVLVVDGGGNVTRLLP